MCVCVCVCVYTAISRIPALMYVDVSCMQSLGPYVGTYNMYVCDNGIKS